MVNLADIYKHGTYYNPAWRHYGEHVNVICDRCQRQNLLVCIGFRENDLCLTCVEQLANREPKVFNPIDNNTTMMFQDLFRTNEKYKVTTRMQQGQFAKYHSRRDAVPGSVDGMDSLESRHMKFNTAFRQECPPSIGMNLWKSNGMDFEDNPGINSQHLDY